MPTSSATTSPGRRTRTSSRWGRPIKHPAGFNVQIKRPLDFQGVTDHSEYMGMVRLANDPSSPI